MEFAPHSNGLLKANTRELEFIAGTKLIENKMGCRRACVPNADDRAARRILGVGVAPKSYRCHQAFGSVHATALSVTHTGDCSVQASH